MIRILLLSSLAILISETAVGAKEGADPADAPSGKAKSYVVELTKFRIEDSAIHKRSTDDIVKAFNRVKDGEEADDVEIVETIRLTALSGHLSKVQVGKTVAVTVGAVHRPGQPPLRQAKQVPIGTVMTAKIIPDDETSDPGDGKVLLSLRYEASHLEGEGTEDSPPDTVSFQSEVTVTAELGKTVFMAGTSAEETSYLVVSVNEL